MNRIKLVYVTLIKESNSHILYYNEWDDEDHYTDGEEY